MSTQPALLDCPLQHHILPRPPRPHRRQHRRHSLTICIGRCTAALLVSHIPLPQLRVASSPQQRHQRPRRSVTGTRRRLSNVPSRRPGQPRRRSELSHAAMRSLVTQLLAVGPELTTFILASMLLTSRGANAMTASTMPSPALDLSQLGRVALAGDFDSISLYDYAGQNEDVFSTNGSQSLLTRYPSGAFQAIAMTDGNIAAMCPFVQKDGTLAGVVVGGNFTSLGGVQAAAIALWNPDTNAITALPGLSGKVSALYCDATAGIVYVGGSFIGANSTNAMAWTTGWTNLPFEGFNGPVSSISKNAAGNIVFGGQFVGLGNTTTPKARDGQVINLASGNITSFSTSSTAGFDNATNIICKTAAQDGPGNTWLLADNTPGYWQGEYSFGFIPTKIRLYNTNQDGRGTKTWYFEDLNSGGILNMSYVDTDGLAQSCSSQCPLPQSNTTSQDFHFSPTVGLSQFRIQIVEWYGSGGGLAGIELFQDDIYSFAVNDFNEPRCDDVSTGSSSTATPVQAWQRRSNVGSTSSDYLSANITQASQLNSSTNIIFTPDIKQSGNYSITMYTPGCVQDGSCDHRGEVNITGTMTTNDGAVTATLFQTNDYDKFDQIYYGYVDVDTDTFKPAVTLSPIAGQTVPLTVVAGRVRFELISSTGGLNGLFEYDPNDAIVGTDFSSSAIDAAGAALSASAVVNAVVSYNNVTIAAGNFTGAGISNVMSIGSNATALPGGGLNSNVQTMYLANDTLYFGGNFTSTADKSVNLSNVATFDLKGNQWAALGAGVGGAVSSIIPLSLNVTAGSPETCLTINGDFTSVNAYNDNTSYTAAGFAVWVPSRGNWLHNLWDASLDVNGKLASYAQLPNSGDVLYAGELMAQGTGLSDAVELLGSGQPSLASLGLNIMTSSSNSSSSSMRRREISSGSNYTGVLDGLFYGQHNLNITILGGNFAATASNGSTVQNLVFVNNTASEQTITGVTGLDSSSVFAAMDTSDTSLFAGGSVSGSVNGHPVSGLIVYDLALGDYAATQPPALQGSNVIVNAISAQPSGNAVYVGGSFSSAGSLPCPALCYYDTSAQQWNSPGSGLGGSISSMFWASNSELIVAGNLTIGGNSTSMVTYDAKKQTFAEYSAASSLPGPVSSISPANSAYNQFWAAGIATNNGSAYLSKFSNDMWVGVAGLGPGTAIRGVQVISLSSDHDESDLVAKDEVLMVFGNINIASYGNASAAFFNGTTFTPFILTNRADGSQGTIGRMFVSNPQNFITAHDGHLALGIIVVIGLFISLGIIFLLVLVGLLMERHRKRKEGYVPMQQHKGGNLSRIPPQSLLGGLREKDNTPQL
nr:polarized growth protein rax2 [Quercus suber]